MKVAVKVRKSRESEFPPTIAVSSQQSAVSKSWESEFHPTGLSVVSRQLVSRAWGNPQGNPKQKHSLL